MNIFVFIDIFQVHYGGVVATGCHGTGVNEKTVSDYVVGMEIAQIAADGTVSLVKYRCPDFWTDSKNTKEEFAAVRCNLGLFGIITEITFKVVPMRNVVVKNLKPLVGELFPEKCLTKKEKNSYIGKFFPEEDYEHGFQSLVLKNLVESHFAVEIFWYVMHQVLT